MIQTFLEATPESLEKMRKSLANKDLVNLGMIAHKIKPSLTFMGIDSLKDIVIEIESLGKAQQEEEKLKEVVPAFILSIEKAMEELRERLKLIE